MYALLYLCSALPYSDILSKLLLVGVVQSIQYNIKGIYLWWLTYNLEYNKLFTGAVHRCPCLHSPSAP